VKRTVSLGRDPLFTAQKAITVSVLTLRLPADPLGVMDSWLDKIEVSLYRNSYTDEGRLIGSDGRPITFVLGRRRSYSVLLNLQLSPGETILGWGSIERAVTVEVEYRETPDAAG
jgi:hypothetical protein